MKGESQVNTHPPCPVDSENSLGYGLEETLSLCVPCAVELNVNPCVKPKAVPPKKTRYIADPAASSLRQSNWVSISREKTISEDTFVQRTVPLRAADEINSFQLWRGKPDYESVKDATRQAMEICNIWNVGLSLFFK